MEYALAERLKMTRGQLIYGDDPTEGITQDEFSMWWQYFRAKAWIEEQQQKKAAKKGGRGQGKRFRY